MPRDNFVNSLLTNKTKTYFAKFNIDLIIRFLYLVFVYYYYYLGERADSNLVLIEPTVTNLNKQITVYTITNVL